MRDTTCIVFVIGSGRSRVNHAITATVTIVPLMSNSCCWMRFLVIDRSVRRVTSNRLLMLAKKARTTFNIVLEIRDKYNTSTCNYYTQQSVLAMAECLDQMPRTFIRRNVFSLDLFTSCCQCLMHISDAFIKIRYH